MRLENCGKKVNLMDVMQHSTDASPAATKLLLDSLTQRPPRRREIPKPPDDSAPKSADNSAPAPANTGQQPAADSPVQGAGKTRSSAGDTESRRQGNRDSASGSGQRSGARPFALPFVILAQQGHVFLGLRFDFGEGSLDAFADVGTLARCMKRAGRK